MKLSPNAHRRFAEMAAGITVASEAMEHLRTESPDVAHNATICSKLIDFEDAAVPLLIETRKLCTADIQGRIENIVGNALERDLDRAIQKTPPGAEEFFDRLEKWVDAARYHVSSGQHALAMGDLTRIRAIADCLSQDVWKAWQAEGVAEGQHLEHFELSEVPGV